MSEEKDQKAPTPQGGSQSPPKETPAPVTVSPGGPENKDIQLSRFRSRLHGQATSQPASTPAPKPSAPSQPSGPPQNVPQTREAPKPSKK